ncbi:MAG: 30S ribosomal protein S5 [Candidatus Liptonbacteria bacterium]|nr:30S ribosomal protein S5 [Candidatus Liptonbacteria bacterium]
MEQNQNKNPNRNRGGRGGDRRRRGGDYITKDAFKERVLDLRRVTRVVAGGKRFRFRATVVIGDEAGSVGVGIAKGADVASSVAKAKADAKKQIIKIPLKGSTIPHDTFAKYSAARVLIRPAPKGNGLKAGGAPRVVLSLAGVKDATAKCLGRTNNKLTNAKATIEALKKLRQGRV